MNERLVRNRPKRIIRAASGLCLASVCSIAPAAVPAWQTRIGEELRSPLTLMVEPAQPGTYTDDEINALRARVAEKCTGPWAVMIGDAVDAALAKPQLTPQAVLDSLLPAAAAVDMGLARCIEAEGASGSAAYVVNGRRLSVYALVQTIRQDYPDEPAPEDLPSVAREPERPPVPFPTLLPLMPIAPLVPPPQPRATEPTPERTHVKPAAPVSAAKVVAPAPKIPAPLLVAPQVIPVAPRPVVVPQYAPRYEPIYVPRRYYGGGGGGCGSRGGPGWRKANGQCASWRD